MSMSGETVMVPTLIMSRTFSWGRSMALSSSLAVTKPIMRPFSATGSPWNSVAMSFCLACSTV